MGKMLWHVTMSLDGFIAGPSDEMAWISDYIGPNATVDDVLGQIGAVLIGGRTYHEAKTEEGKVYGGAWSGPQFVLTHAAAGTAAPGFTFLSGEINAVVRTVQEAATDKYVAILGANTAKQVLEAGLLDEILVHIAPVLLGDGVRLFDRPGGATVGLERMRLSESPAVTDLWFRVA
jgi:dihydrofolate reductase